MATLNHITNNFVPTDQASRGYPMTAKPLAPCLIATLAILTHLGSTSPARGEPPAAPQPPAGQPTRLIVYPERITLDGPRSQQQLIVLAEYPDGRQWDHTRTAQYQLEGAAVVQVLPQGLTRPLADGQAHLRVTVQGVQARVPVQVTRASADVPVGFTREVEPILTLTGCNQGACHGAQHGRGGFRLSLRGFDPAFDYAQIVQSAEGRRVVMSDPAASILLQKPTLQMEHGGGEKLKLHSPHYEVLLRWLQDGTPEPTAADPVVTRLEVYPPRRVMVPGESQQLLVLAVWSDGLRQDVTALSQFDAINDAIATVTPQGVVTAQERGETHVMVRFGGQAAVMQATLPYARLDPYPPLPRHNFVDDLLISKWRTLGLVPSELASDSEFFRRIHLDAIGTLPTPQQVRDFLADPDPHKRAKAIDQVLNRPEFYDYWTLKWGDLLRINSAALDAKGMWSFRNWVRQALRENMPVDRFVREIITAEGSTYTEGPANFYRIGRTPEDWAETVAQVFMGIRLQCAKCHQHPFERFSQDDYYGLAAFFARLATKKSDEFGIFGREQVVYVNLSGDIRHPRKQQIVPPRPLDGPIMDDPLDRRVKLAEWLTAPDNPYFARNLVNRFWGYLMGRGLVEPLDDMRSTNPASNPALLDALAQDFAQHQFDLKHLMRTIMNSRAYQLSSVPTPGNAIDATNTHFTRYSVRRLTAEQLADAIDTATGTQEKYTGLPLGVRAIELPDSRITSYLLDVFGRPARQIACECERSGQPNIAQALHLLNGTTLNKKIAAPTGRIESALKAKRALPEIIDELYLVTLSRPPRPDELAHAQRWVREAPSVREGLQDLLWTLLNSREFLFNR